MKKIFLLIVIVIAFIIISDKKTDSIREPEYNSEVSGLYGNEQEVTVKGYDDVLMEPFISRDGGILFFNSRNDAKDTSLFYATRIDDFTFNFVGEVGGVNGEVPHLDAVASMDDKNNFYWVSLRDYPNTLENLNTGIWSNGIVENIKPVLGDFYNRTPGWLVMDAEVSPDGETLYYVNADFRQGGSVPSEAKIRFARKDGNLFKSDGGSDRIMAQVNKFALVYAPSISSDGLRLLFTRLVPGKGTEQYIALRDSKTVPFNEPELLDIDGELMEGGSFTLDAKTIYYHKKSGSGYGLFAMTETN